MVIACEIRVTGSFGHQSGSFIPLIHKGLIAIFILFNERVIPGIRCSKNDMVGILALKLEYKEEFGFRAVSGVLIITVTPIGADIITRIIHVREIPTGQHLGVNLGCRYNGGTVVTTSVQREETFVLHSDVIVHRAIELGYRVAGVVSIDDIVFGCAGGNRCTFCNR